jgi:hypothetical protein
MYAPLSQQLFLALRSSELRIRQAIQEARNMKTMKSRREKKKSISMNREVRLASDVRGPRKQILGIELSTLIGHADFPGAVGYRDFANSSHAGRGPIAWRPTNISCNL